MNGGLLRILRILSTLGLPLLWAVCVFVPCAVSVFSSAHCCLPSPLHSPPPSPCSPACSACLTWRPLPRPPKASRYFYNTCSLTVSNGKICCRSRSDNAALWQGGGQCDSVAVRQWGTVVRQSQSLLSSSYSSQWRCLVAISLSFRFGKLFFRLPCAPLCHTPLAFVDSIIRHCWLLPAACCLLLALC